MRIVYFLLLITLASCVINNSENAKLLQGKWRGISWTVNEQPSNYKANETSFSFDALNNYSFNYDGTLEKGTYIVKENKLYTTAYNQQEIMVEIEKLTVDTLIFRMNRGGQMEQLTLLKSRQ